MGALSYIILLIIALLVGAKNWDKIKPLFDKKGGTATKQQDNITEGEVRKVKQDRIQYLLNEKQRKIDIIKNKTGDLREEIRDIDIELKILEGQK